MSNVNLQVNVRQRKGKSYRKELARRGMIPGVVYGKAVGSIPVEVELKPLQKILSSNPNAIIDLTIKGSGLEKEKQYKVLIKDAQYGIIQHDLISVDLHQISLDNKIDMTVPLKFTGEVGDGIAQFALRELQVSCLPVDIPKEITVNIEGLSVGDTIAVRDIAVPDKVEVLDEPGATVLTVVAQGVEESPDIEAEAGEGEAGTAGDETPA
ncbi:50S ribosomal protein L25 [Desulfallas thermosapovorans]|uniref:Large ribosomal subunit protein bL25 n=1 Tax=Desulfallas thermosapovorans DSM 6562 TaxID=1121431 RepID=A0A5S4ZXX1_9FIRM|nr:50S ribosomal protein L25 [Desulfallas thermosapovorans]TYO96977.1 LSU ribosomal protein L25P [Desulfallas thermosapovorans DSM 6562]